MVIQRQATLLFSNLELIHILLEKIKEVMSARKSAFYMLFLLLYSLVSNDALADGFAGTALPLWAVAAAPTSVALYIGII